MENTNLVNTGDRKLVRAHEVANLLGISLETIYDWKYRARKRNIPAGMFVKIGKMLFINTVVLNTWLMSQTTLF